mgnify:CR=1 FL=1
MKNSVREVTEEAIMRDSLDKMRSVMGSENSRTGNAKKWAKIPYAVQVDI